MNGMVAGISWLFGDFRVVRFQRGKVIGVYHAAEPVLDLPGFNHALAEAHAVLRLPAGAIALTYIGDDSSHMSFEAPPMTAPDLERYVTRRVDQEKNFTGPAAHVFRVVSDERESTGKTVLVHFAPRHIVSAIIRICEEYFLNVRYLIPLAELGAKLGVEGDTNSQDVLVTAIYLEGRAVLSVVRAEVGVVFTRTINCGEAGDAAARLAAEISRTVLFAKQKVGKSINAVCLLTAGGDFREQVVGQIEIPVRDVHLDDPAFVWPRAACTHATRDIDNLVPRFRQRVSSRRAVTRTAMFAAAALWIGALVVVSSIQYVSRSVVERSARAVTALPELEIEVGELEARIAADTQLRERLRQLTPTLAPVPIAFMSQVGSLLTDDLTMTRTAITYNDEHWRVVFEGISNATLGTTLPRIERLVANLERAPWSAWVDPSWRQIWLQQLRSGAAADGQIGFALEGALQ